MLQKNTRRTFCSEKLNYITSNVSNSPEAAVQGKTCHNWLSGNNPKEINAPWLDAASLQYLTNIDLFPKLVVILQQKLPKNAFFQYATSCLKLLDKTLVIE